MSNIANRFFIKVIAAVSIIIALLTFLYTLFGDIPSAYSKGEFILLVWIGSFVGLSAIYFLLKLYDKLVR